MYLARVRWRSVKLVVLGATLVALIFTIRWLLGMANANGAIFSTTGLVGLTYPTGFTLRKETRVATDERPRADGTYARTPMSVIGAGDDLRGTGIFAASAVTRGLLMVDLKHPWRLDPALNADLEKLVEAHVERKLTFHETRREEATCAGQKGDAVTSTFDDGKEPGTLFRCSFFLAGNAYMLGYIVYDRSAADAPQLRALVDRMQIFVPRSR